jgi:hypothetical protein
MDDARLHAQNLAICSGIVEAACKTLATQRIERLGQRWNTGGGQAILALRSLAQSGGLDAAWKLLSEENRRDITSPDNIVPLPYRRPSV